jgi:hypothetical protein
MTFCEQWYVTVRGEEKGDDKVDGPMTFLEASSLALQLHSTFPGVVVVLSKELKGASGVQASPQKQPTKEGTPDASTEPGPGGPAD